MNWLSGIRQSLKCATGEVNPFYGLSWVCQEVQNGPALNRATILIQSLPRDFSARSGNSDIRRESWEVCV